MMDVRPLPNKNDVEMWSVEQVAAWLLDTDLSDCRDVILQNHIDGHTLLNQNLTERDLMMQYKSIPIDSRRKIHNLCFNINQQKNRKSRPRNTKGNHTLTPGPLTNSGTGGIIGYKGGGTSDSRTMPWNKSFNSHFKGTLNNSLSDNMFPTNNNHRLVTHGNSTGSEESIISGEPFYEELDQMSDSMDEQDLRLDGQFYLIPTPQQEKRFPNIGQGGSPNMDAFLEKDNFYDTPLVKISGTNYTASTTDASASLGASLKPPSTYKRELLVQSSSLPAINTSSSAPARDQHLSPHVRKTPSPTTTRPQLPTPPIPKPRPQTTTIPQEPNPQISKYNPALVSPPLGIAPSAPSGNYNEQQLQQKQKIKDKKSEDNVHASLYQSLSNQDYFQEITRKKADKLLKGGTDGLFLIRPSDNDPVHPLTLCLSLNQSVLNIRIRIRDDRKYALGTKKPNELYFSTVEEIIGNHKVQSIITETGVPCKLLHSPPKGGGESLAYT